MTQPMRPCMMTLLRFEVHRSMVQETHIIQLDSSTLRKKNTFLQEK